MLLKPNMNWAANQKIQQPTVLADVRITQDYINVSFTVEEPSDCFRAEVAEDNSTSWEDSCVEIFIQNPGEPEEYFNFEVTSRGFILAARGKNRNERQKLSPAEISKILRTKQLASVAGNLTCWGMEVQIPASIFGLDFFVPDTIKGNLYKCADKAKVPHYQSAFPVETEKPDFHRPEFFRKL